DGNLLLGMGRKTALQSQKHYTDDPSEKCPLAPPAVAVAATFHHPNPSSETSLKAVGKSRDGTPVSQDAMPTLPDAA
ncbi:MAG: hypothetical protein WC383_18085, partial [Gammaproteobacteria bacterium]